MIKDYFKFAISSLTHRQLRTWLTMIGIFIGITAVVAIISLGQGLQVAIDEQFAKLGNDKIIISPGTSSFGGATSVVLSDKDKKVINNVPGVDSTIGFHYQTIKVEYKDEQAFVLSHALPIDEDPDLVEELYGAYGYYEGRGLEKGDNSKVVLGNYYAFDKKIFDKRVNLGDKITIDGYDLNVVGFYESFGNAGDDQTVYMPKDAYEKITGIDVDEDYLMLFTKVSEGEDPLVIADRIKKALRNSRGVDEGEEDFTLQTTDQMMDSFNSILLIVQVVIVGIAAISLLVGGVGIMNTMYTAVVERTKEIGIMKAIGAKNSDILLIFLIESGLLGMVGGAVGIIFGLSFSKIIEFGGTVAFGTPYLRAWYSWGLILGALGFSFIVGALSGLAPAYQASKQKPVDSLRYE